MKRADFCPFDLSMTCPYNSKCRGENQSSIMTSYEEVTSLAHVRFKVDARERDEIVCLGEILMQVK